MPKHNQMEVKMQLIKVKVVEESKGILEYFDDDKKIFETEAFLGRNGVTTNKKEGDLKTPIGSFNLGIAFGIHDIQKELQIPYIQINENLYWVDDVNSRYYNPAWGRFINADGIINADEVINGFNLYAYTTNNPIKYIDDTGKGGLLAGILYKGAQFIAAAVATIAAYALLQDATEAVVSVATRPNGSKKKKKDDEEQDPKI